MDLNLVKTITIPEGTVSSVAINGNIIWKKKSIIRIIPDDIETYPAELHGWTKITYNGTESWSQQTSNKWFHRYESTTLYQSSDYKGYCDVFPTTTSTTMPDNTFVPAGYNSTGRILFQYKTAENVSSWTAFLSSNPISVLVPLATNDNSLWIAVKKDNIYGYLNQETEEFCGVYGMTGSAIDFNYSVYEPLAYIYFDGSSHIELPITLSGNDTLRIKFCVWTTQGNLCGYYSGNAADSNQYSIYTSSTSAYVRYDGVLKRGWAITTKKIYTLVMTPTGYTDNYGYSDTWTQSTFTTGNSCIGGLPNSTSNRSKSKYYWFVVDGKCMLYPAKRRTDDVIGMVDILSGSFYTGSFMHESTP